MFFEFFSSHQKSNLRFFFILFLSFLVTHLALAIPVDYPNKPVKIIVPVAPGGGVDLVARTIADRLTKALGQSFIVENQSGGGGAIGSQTVARASSDGYTLLLSYVGTHGTNPAVRKLPYDAQKDFTHIAMIGGTPNVLVVHPSVNTKNLKEFVQKVSSLDIEKALEELKIVKEGVPKEYEDLVSKFKKTVEKFTEKITLLE